MRPFPLAICRKFPRAIVLVLRISFPVPLGARKCLAARRRKLCLAAARRRSGRAAARRLRRAQKAPRETEKHGVILVLRSWGAAASRLQPARAGRWPGRPCASKGLCPSEAARRLASRIGNRRLAAALSRGGGAQPMRIKVKRRPGGAAKRKTRAAGAGGRSNSHTISPIYSISEGLSRNIFALMQLTKPGDHAENTCKSRIDCRPPDALSRAGASPQAPGFAARSPAAGEALGRASADRRIAALAWEFPAPIRRG